MTGNTDSVEMQNREMKPRVSPLLHCPGCGAENHAFVAKCWICHKPFGKEVEHDERETSKKPEFSDGPGLIFGNLLLGCLLLALVVIGIGVFRINSTWLIYYVALISLPLLAGAIGLRQALISNNPDIRTAGAVLTSIYVTVLTIFGTAAVVIATVIALIVSFFVALGQVCSDLLNAGN